MDSDTQRSAVSWSKAKKIMQFRGAACSEFSLPHTAVCQHCLMKSADLHASAERVLALVKNVTDLLEIQLECIECGSTDRPLERRSLALGGAALALLEAIANKTETEIIDYTIKYKPGRDEAVSAT
jgi:hypothetical protein